MARWPLIRSHESGSMSRGVQTDASPMKRVPASAARSRATRHLLGRFHCPRPGGYAAAERPGSIRLV
jgi:hypothetical protein